MKFLKFKWLLIILIILGTVLLLITQPVSKASVAQIIPAFEGKKGGIELKDTGEYLRIGIDLRELDSIELFENDKRFLRLYEITNASQETRFKVSLFNRDGDEVNIDNTTGCQANWARDFTGEWLMPMSECDLRKLKEIVKSNDLVVFLVLGGTDMLNNQGDPYTDKDLVSIDINKSGISLGQQRFLSKVPWKLTAITDKGKVDLVKEVKF